MAKRGTLEHPKNRRLARALGTIPGVTLGLIESLWHYVAQWHSHGRLTRLDLEEALDRSGGWLAMFKVEQLIEAMTHPDYRWLDLLGDGSYYVHDWHEHCEDAVHAKLYRRLELFGNGSRPQPKKVDLKTRKELDKAWAAKYGTTAAVPVKTAAGTPETAAKEDAAENGSQRRPAIALAIAIAKPEPKPMPPPLAAGGDDDGERPGRQYDLGKALILPPVVLEAMRSYTPEVQRSAWEVLQMFTRQSPGQRSTAKLGELAAVFADVLCQRPEARHKFNEYFSVTDSREIEKLVAQGSRLPPRASPWDICNHLFPPVKATQGPTGPTKCNALEREKAKIAEAKANPVTPEHFAELKKKALAMAEERRRA